MNYSKIYLVTGVRTFTNKFKKGNAIIDGDVIANGAEIIEEFTPNELGYALYELSKMSCYTVESIDTYVVEYALLYMDNHKVVDVLFAPEDTNNTNSGYTSLRYVNVGDICTLGYIWDGEGDEDNLYNLNVMKGSWAYPFDFDYDTWVNYSFDIIKWNTEHKLESTIKITDISLI